jgi:antitoxin (DNA-binding transcriptional repressor) of toxin-antitoxin stability system
MGYNVAREENFGPRTSHSHFAICARAEKGGIIVIERRGEPVAELRPITVPPLMPAGKRDRIFDSMGEIWARIPQLDDSTKIIEEDRDR